MLLSRKWLHEFVAVDAGDREFAEAMTLSGSKVETTTDLGAEISNVVVGKILSMERHPDSDHMWVCQLDVGQDEPVQIVTGAWNIHTGDLVPVALHKSTLPGGKKIERGKLRGVLSDGMLCSLKELGLDERDFPYGVITAAALLGDYRPIDPGKLSIPEDVRLGHKVFGPVVVAGAGEVRPLGDGRWSCALVWAEDDTPMGTTVETDCPDIHSMDLMAFNTRTRAVCPLADLNAKQSELFRTIPVDVQPGHKIFGPVLAARVDSIKNMGEGVWQCKLSYAEKDGPSGAVVLTTCQNIHEGDLVAYNTGERQICTLADLHAEQREFPHCIPDGIFVLQEEGIGPGDDIRPVINADDHVVEFEITPNRPDCLSVIGLAREAAATFDKPCRFHQPVVKGGGPGSLADLLDVETPAADLVPRYTARMVRNVKIAPSPKWMRERLRSMGVRPINNIVDITNYVMLEYGQPMHAFDYRYVKGGKIVVRRARDGEELTTLDGNVRKLTANHLVIADETRAVGLAGIMGGENSEIVADTADVVFESACFDGTCIRKGALSLGMRTEASAKFEKGLDPLNTLPAVDRACELVELLGAGEVVDGVIDILNYVPQSRVLKLEPDRINALLGTDVSENVMYTILQKLGFETTKQRGMLKVPSWRGDVEGMADLAEEVARFHGYNNIPTTLMRGQTTLGGYSEEQELERRLGALCRACGYDEIITYSFISPACYDKIRWPQDDPRRQSFKILNPLGEDTSIMRTTVLPSMLEILTRNYNFRNKAARLYEVGRIYLPGGEDGLAVEKKMLSLGAYGEMDFYVLKGVVEAIMKDLRARDVSFRPCGTDPSYHPGRCAQVLAGDKVVGVFGQIHPLAAKNYDVDCPFFCAELELDALLDVKGPDPEYVPLPKFPSVTRDIALVCSEEVTVGALEEAIRRGARGLLKEVSLFDIYRGANIPEGKKSVAFNLVLRADDRSLTGEEADDDVKSILETVKAELGAVLR